MVEFKIISEVLCVVCKNDIQMTAERKNVLKIGLPTSWEIKLLSDTVTITCKPPIKMVYIEDRINNQRIECSQYEYQNALRKFENNMR